MSRDARWSVARETARTQLWPLPAACIGLAVVAGVVLPAVEARTNDELPPALTAYLFGGGAEAARTVLSAIASSLITVTSLTFSLTVVTLQLASSQFSPRLLRTFTQDRLVHATLAVFLATFTFSLTVLRTVRSAEEAGGAAFIPQISVTLALLLALASVVTLVLFLAHLTRKIRVETLLRDVHRETSGLARRLLDEYDPDHTPEPVELPLTGTVPLLAESSGFLIRVEEQPLLGAAARAKATVAIERPPGASLIAGTPIGRVWASDPGQALDIQTLTNAVRETVITGYERTSTQDVGYGLRQITDVAIKALSPSINDPTTATYALGHSAALLCELTGRDLGPRRLHDTDGTLRLVLARPTLAELLDLSVTQPRRYGASDAKVLLRILRLLREVAWSARTADHRRAVVNELARTRLVVSQHKHDPTETVELAEAATMVEEALAGQWPASDHAA